MSTHPGDGEDTGLDGDLTQIALRFVELEARVEDLTDMLTTFVSQGAPAAPAATPPPARSWAARASVEEWDALIEWVDWLVDTYEAAPLSNNLPGCWPAHGGLVEELAAVHLGWRAAQSIAAQGDTDAVAVWHDRTLWPFIARLAAYQTSTCRNGMHKNVPTRFGTKREYVVVQATGGIDPTANVQ